MTEGVVYILINEAMPGYPDGQAATSSTGSPAPLR